MTQLFEYDIAYSVFSNNPIWISDPLIDTPSVKQSASMAENSYDPSRQLGLQRGGGFKKVNTLVPGVIYHDEKSGYSATLYARTANGHTDYAFAQRG